MLSEYGTVIMGVIHVVGMCSAGRSLDDKGITNPIITCHVVLSGSRPRRQATIPLGKARLPHSARLLPFSGPTLGINIIRFPREHDTLPQHFSSDTHPVFTTLTCLVFVIRLTRSSTGCNPLPISCPPPVLHWILTAGVQLPPCWSGPLKISKTSSSMARPFPFLMSWVLPFLLLRVHVTYGSSLLR